MKRRTGTTHTWIARDMRIHQEHDHGAAQMDGAILVVAATMVRCTDAGTHSVGRQVGVPAIVVFLNNAHGGKIRNCWNWGTGSTRTVEEHGFPGDTIAIVRGSALQALNGDAKWEGQD